MYISQTSQETHLQLELKIFSCNFNFSFVEKVVVIYRDE